MYYANSSVTSTREEQLQYIVTMMTMMIMTMLMTMMMMMMMIVINYNIHISILESFDKFRAVLHKHYAIGPAFCCWHNEYHIVFKCGLLMMMMMR